MPFVVERTAQAKAAVDDTMTRNERGAYAAAVASLKGEGCRAGGYRLRGVDGDDYPLCSSTYAPIGGCSPPTSTTTAS